LVLAILKLEKDKIGVLLQNIVLFVIAVIIVIAFYFHGIFYEFGLPLLLLWGGVLTFSLFKIIMWSSKKVSKHAKIDGVLLFKDKEKDLIIHGLKKQTILPARRTRMKVGEIYRAKINIMSKKYFAELEITDILEKELESLTYEDLKYEGINSFKEFRIDWLNRYGAWHEGNKIRLIRFNVVD
jgi:hypothetical protein